jgi:hypothetical protein
MVTYCYKNVGNLTNTYSKKSQPKEYHSVPKTLMFGIDKIIFSSAEVTG